MGRYLSTNPPRSLPVDISTHAAGTISLGRVNELLERDGYKLMLLSDVRPHLRR